MVFEISDSDENNIVTIFWNYWALHKSCGWKAPSYQSQLKRNGRRCSFLHELFHLQFTYTLFYFPFHICCLAGPPATWCYYPSFPPHLTTPLLFRPSSFHRATWGPQLPCQCAHLLVSSHYSYNLDYRSAGLIFLSYRGRKWGEMILSDFSKVPQDASGRV